MSCASANSEVPDPCPKNGKAPERLLGKDVHGAETQAILRGISRMAKGPMFGAQFLLQNQTAGAALGARRYADFLASEQMLHRPPSSTRLTVTLELAK